MKIKPGDYIATEGLTDRQISEFLMVARESGFHVASSDPNHRAYHIHARPYTGVDPDARPPRIASYHHPGFGFGPNARQIPWPPEPEQPSPWPQRIWTALAFLVIFTLVMFVGVVEWLR